MPLKLVESALLKPCSSDTTAITDITPMMMPKVVSTLRSLWAKMAAKAARKLSIRLYTGRAGLRRLGVVHRIAGDLAVLDADHPAAVVGDVLIVGHHHDGITRLVQFVEHGHHVAGGAGIQVAGGLVRQQDRGRAHQGAGDGHALAL